MKTSKPRTKMVQRTFGPQRTFYKVVVRKDNGGMISSVARDFMQLQYALGKTTFPLEGTGILAFKSLKDAKDFMISLGRQFSVAILRGTGKETRLGRWSDPLSNDVASLRTAWRTFLEWNYLGLREWPKGTVALESFSPNKIVSGDPGA